MQGVVNSIRVENFKLNKSFLIWITPLFFMILASLHLKEANWSLYFEELTFLFSNVIGSLGFAMIASWSFGREFSDRTFQDLLALPIPRTTIIVSKFVTINFWCLVMTLISFAGAVALGLIAQIPDFTIQTTIHSLKDFMILANLNLMLLPLIALIASISRGYMVPNAFAFASVVIAAMLGGGDFGKFIPSAIPSLFYAVDGNLPFISYIVLYITAMIGILGTIYWWTRRDQQ